MERRFEESSVEVESIVTNSYSGKEQIRKSTLSLVETTDFGWVVRISRGGVTGWEYFGVERKSDLAKDFQNGWLACAGGGEWDKLYISGTEMIKALTALELI